MTNRIFLTGGTGFFGKWLLMTRPADCELVVLSRDPRRFLALYPEFADLPGISFVAGDVRNFDFPAGRFDAVIHAATDVVVTLSDDEMFQVIADGTLHVLDFARRCGAEKILMTSSGAVYGVQEPELPHIPESHVCAPVSAYGKGKRYAEQMCIDSGLKALLPRCFAFVGPYLSLDGHFAIGNFIGNALRRQPIVIRGDGRPFRSYLYAADLARYLWTILAHGEHARFYNVGSSEPFSIAELAAIVADELAPGLEIQVCGVADPATPAPRYIPDVSRIDAELGLRPAYDLRQAIRLTGDFYRARLP